ncbi:hypothetical protein RM844_25060 [Streptomyces sp. DSM 44915]|uniref:Uncharacterized protein n=1 Tax=Streptomyces chisholmiae TaxID=3075540 RepID=A0ABU2JXH0_9ACTN|nr:hypothetical protein [Streptomyces sp. DSM 44915]MDT0269557.1 hypothetical protein [Streptomyces sp. DSM 44915]
MQHEMRAEYWETDTEQSPPWPVKTWHMVRQGERAAMCGRELRPDARGLSDAEWGRTPEPMCHTCGALYLREVP